MRERLPMAIETDRDRPSLMVGGKPLSAPLRNVHSLSEQLVTAFVDNVAPCATLPGDVLAGDVTAITRFCLEFTVAMLDGRQTPDRRELERLAQAAAQWAREGIPIDAILRAVHEGFRIVQRRIVDSGTERDFASIVEAAFVVIEALDAVTTTIATAYVGEHRQVSHAHHTAVHALTSALLSGHATAPMARQCGIAIAESYTVLAVRVPPHRDESDPALNRDVVARRKLRRVQAELIECTEGQALSLLSVDGGTVLLPEGCGEPLGELIERLSRAAQAAVVAAATTAATEEIPAAVEQAHEVLELVGRLGRGPGLHRFADVALEYQLTRPGPGRRHLASLLDPLADHPVLTETLRAHLGNDLNRRKAARQLNVHVNTLDYRLRKIARLTGFDPTQPSGLRRLQAALLARDLSA